MPQVELEQVHNWRFISPLDPVYKACHCAPSDMYRNGLTDLADWIPQNVEHGLLREGVDYFLNLFEVKKYWKDHIEGKGEQDMVRESPREDDKECERASKLQQDNTTQQDDGALVAKGEEEGVGVAGDSGVPDACDVEGMSRAVLFCLALPCLAPSHPPTYHTHLPTR